MASIQFRLKSVRRHMQKHFPNCPEIHCGEIVRRVADRVWEDTTIGGAVGIIVTNYVRHRLTDYEMLMKRHGLTREEARIAEADAVSDIVSSWQPLLGLLQGPATGGLI
ncbi:MAG: DUF2293 domain-containing protein [Hoeflea sp.]|uniref:DUF2293 domain-containing protein n=1 Tax=Hoeflea sp. TaxID=1940281 RepID=UPI00272F3595|nr:DUF2293 domain-containing protein [Hoeflea sp.]MDP2120675.1 DUF2293 domain-containing protein [Hoeflea sp.]